jgi:hypothetical protein
MTAIATTMIAAATPMTAAVEAPMITPARYPTPGELNRSAGLTLFLGQHAIRRSPGALPGGDGALGSRPSRQTIGQPFAFTRRTKGGASVCP